MGEIFLRRSPLKILPSMKGTLAMGTVFLLLTFVFSLTTGPISRKLVYPASFSKGKKNVLILSIEGLRGDNMHKEAPNISLVRSRSVRFSHTYSDSLHPQKAMTALLGGQHSWLRESYLSDDFESLAEILLRNGYHTSAVVNELELGIHSGLDQGFERYTYLPSNAPLPFTEGARRVKLIDLLLGFWARLGSDPGRYHRSSVEVLQRVQQDVESFGEENWFVFAQIRELDPPYFLEEHNEFYRAEKGEEEQAYQERLKSLDASFGAFWHWLERRDRNLILVLMSTHPPSYADGPPRFQIPLSIMVPQSHVQEVQHHAQLIDIPPTLAAIIGLPAHHWNGVDLLQENHPREGRPIYSHSPQGWSMVQFDGWRYMLDAQNEEGHLYNIRQDPMLQNNLWHEEPNRRSQLQEVFRTSP
jgi:membrane-anchored protein YejM (alkaline phosphatase superfamily)